jgi:hypothetical protein
LKVGSFERHARALAYECLETELKHLRTLRDGRLCSVFAIAALLAACGGSGSSAPTSAADAAPQSVAGAAQPATPASDPAPQISGVAATTAKVGQSYSFQPSAKDMDNRVLTFAISGAPAWLTFNSTTGRIAGTPTSADVGTDRAIVLQVSNGTSAVELAPFSITVVAADASSGSASLSWQAPTENTDGSALLDLGGYVIYYGSASKTYTSTITISNPGLTSYVVEDLQPGTYYFSMTSMTTSGEQSSPSAEASKTIS